MDGVELGVHGRVIEAFGCGGVGRGRILVPMTGWKLNALALGPMDNNVYFLSKDGSGVVIDCATDADAILKVADDNGFRITDVITTHSHYDHVGALREVLAATGARHHASAGDAPDLPAAVDRVVADGEQFDFAAPELRGLSGVTLHGHTTEGLCVVVPPGYLGEETYLFTGDSLFPGGVGKTHTPEQFASLLGDVTNKLFDVFDDATKVFPGHGKATTLGEERPHLGEWAARGW